MRQVCSPKVRFRACHRTRLSYVSLSTPHNGSVGADFEQAYYIRTEIDKRAAEFVGFPDFVAEVAELVETNAGTEHLTSSSVARFNSINLPALAPVTTVFGTIAADADEDILLSPNADKIDRLAEFDGLEIEGKRDGLKKYLQILASSADYKIRITNTVYQTIGRVGSISLNTANLKYQPSNVPVVVPLPIVAEGVTVIARENDIMVRTDSAHGRGTFERYVLESEHTFTFAGPAGRDHATILDAGVAYRTLIWLHDIDRNWDGGDLQQDSSGGLFFFP